MDSNDEFRSGDFIELCDEPYVDADGYSSGDSSESSDEDGTQARPPCKVSTYKPLVNSLDKWLDPSCYDSHDFGTTDSIADEKVLVGYFGPKKNPKTQKIQWTNEKPYNIGRQRACDFSSQSHL